MPEEDLVGLCQVGYDEFWLAERMHKLCISGVRGQLGNLFLPRKQSFKQCVHVSLLEAKQSVSIFVP